MVESPITGPAGNVEYLMFARTPRLTRRLVEALDAHASASAAATAAPISTTARAASPTRSARRVGRRITVDRHARLRAAARRRARRRRRRGVDAAACCTRAPRRTGALLAAVSERGGAAHLSRGAPGARRQRALHDRAICVGARAAWTDPRSASGYLFPQLAPDAAPASIPRYDLASESRSTARPPRALRAPSPTDSADVCACFVSDAAGRRRAAGARSSCAQALGEPSAGALRVLDVTDPIPPDGMVLAPPLDGALQAPLRDALLSLHADEAGRARSCALCSAPSGWCRSPRRGRAHRARCAALASRACSGAHEDPAHRASPASSARTWPRDSLARGDAVVGLDNFDETLYPAALHRRNLAARRRQPASTSSRATSSTRRWSTRLFARHASTWWCTWRRWPACARRWRSRSATSASTSRARSTCSRPAARTASRASSSPRRRRCTARTIAKCRSARTIRPMRPASPYAATKRAGELFCSNYSDLYGIATTALRFFTVYGPRQRPEMAIHKFARLIATASRCRSSATAARRATTPSSTTSSTASWRRSIAAAAGGAAPRLQPRRLAHDDAGAAGRAARGRRSGKSAVLDRQPDQPGDVPITYADVTRAARELGYAPKVPIEEGIARFCAWLRASSSVVAR